MIVGRCLLNCSRVFSTVIAAQIKVAVGVGWKYAGDEEWNAERGFYPVRHIDSSAYPSTTERNCSYRYSRYMFYYSKMQPHSTTSTNSATTSYLLYEQGFNNSGLK
jgi:hypothetical protein